MYIKRSNSIYILSYTVSRNLKSIENFNSFGELLTDEIYYKLQIKNDVSKL